MYKGKLKEIKTSGKDITKHKSPLSEEDMSKLRVHLKSHMNTPKGLQEKVMFDVLYFFGRRGREGLRELKRDSFEFVEDGEGNEYAHLPFNEFDKNHCDVMDTESNETDKRIYSQNSDDCPVASLKKYISHLNVDHESFFQRPNPHFTITTGRWYDCMPVGKCTLGGLMTRLSYDAGLSKKYTNHCIRATTVTTLKHQGYSNADICSVTGHKSETSLVNYCKEPCDTRKKELSTALFKKGRNEPSATVSSAPESFEVMPRASSNTQNINQSVYAPCLEQAKSLFSGAIFNGPVNLHVHMPNSK